MYDLKELSTQEQERFIEIQFYLFVEHLLEQYNRSAIIYTIIDTLAELFSCNVTILKTLVQSINNRSSSIIPTKFELGIVMYRKGIPVRKIRDKINMHPQTLYRYLDQYHNKQYDFIPMLDDEVREQVKQFLQQLEVMMGWF